MVKEAEEEVGVSSQCAEVVWRGAWRDRVGEARQVWRNQICVSPRVLETWSRLQKSSQLRCPVTY